MAADDDGAPLLLPLALPDDGALDCAGCPPARGKKVVMRVDSA